MFVSLHISFVDILKSDEMVLEGGAFGSWLSHESRALLYGISALIKKTPKVPLPIIPCEDTVNQEAGPQQTQQIS